MTTVDSSSLHIDNSKYKFLFHLVKEKLVKFVSCDCLMFRRFWIKFDWNIFCRFNSGHVNWKWNNKCATSGTSSAIFSSSTKFHFPSTIIMAKILFSILVLIGCVSSSWNCSLPSITLYVVVSHIVFNMCVFVGLEFICEICIEVIGSKINFYATSSKLQRKIVFFCFVFGFLFRLKNAVFNKDNPSIVA